MSTRTLRALTALLVAGIAAIAFLVSFDAISAYAARVGAFPPRLGFCAPLLVDSFTVAAGLVILLRARDGARAVYAWALVACAAITSVSLNIAHAPPHPAARAVAALPSTALLAAVELVMSEARRHRHAHPSADALHPSAGLGAPAAPPAPAEQGGQDGPLRPLSSRDLVRELLARNPRVGVEEVIAATEVGRRRAYELLAQARAEHAGRNGAHTPPAQGPQASQAARGPRP